MSKIAEYRGKLRELKDWVPFLLQESHLPGPRGNLELVHAVADEGSEELFRHLLSYDAAQAPTNSPQEFLAVCGVVGLGRLLAEGKIELLETLRGYAADPRWRTREGVAMALQRLGAVNGALLLREMEKWSTGSFLEQRAAIAGLCEPKLLRDEAFVSGVLEILDKVTRSLSTAVDRKGDDFKTLRQGLGYCWSVAVVAQPESGKALMEKWGACDDKDVRWVVKENLKKKRLERMDAAWVREWKAKLS